MILERIIFTGTVVRSGNSSNEKIMSTRGLGRRNHSLPGFLLLTFLMSNASAPAFVLCSLHVDAVPAAAQDEVAVPIFFSKSSSSCAAQIVSAKGGIKGRVLDEEIKSPIAWVTVKVAGTLFSAVTDVAGNFAISAVPVGGYSLEFTCQYYHSRIQTDVIVKSEHITTVEVEMKLSIDAKRREEVTVRAGYFTVSEQQPLSRAGFSYEEIRRAAGAEGDISRIVDALPYVGRPGDVWKNSLIIRGGSPMENAFYVDNIEVPNINHFPALGSTGGAIGLLNVDFIRDLRFYSGGFAPQFGDRLSSVMDISLREGNRDGSDFELDLSMAGVGAVVEGPLPGQKGSWMLSVRKSYIDLLIDLMGQGVAPNYSDALGKFSYDLSTSGKLSFIGILGLDKSGTKQADAVKDKEPFFGSADSTEHAAGVNWFQMWGSKGYSNTSISESRTRYEDRFSWTVGEGLARHNMSREQSWTVRHVTQLRLDERNKLGFGFETKRVETGYEYFLGEYTDVLGAVIPASGGRFKVAARKFAAFVNHIWNPVPRLGVSLGVRADYFSYNESLHVSPRFSLSLELTKKMSIEAAAGLITHSLPMAIVLRSSAPRNLKDPQAWHFVLGLRRILTDNTLLTVEVYDEEYRSLPLDPAQPYLSILDESSYSCFLGGHERLIAMGWGRSCGVEVMVQKKLADKVYGIVSGSYFRSRYRDLEGTWRDRAYDCRYILSIEGGWKPNRFWEFSLEWNYAGGNPYTPFDIETSRATNTGIFDLTKINAERLPAYHALNLRADKRFYFRRSNLILYLSIWNVFDRKNAVTYYWNTLERKPGMVRQFGIVPALGVEFEF